jgi:hypothetical protein
LRCDVEVKPVWPGEEEGGGAATAKAEPEAEEGNDGDDDGGDWEWDALSAAAVGSVNSTVPLLLMGTAGSAAGSQTFDAAATEGIRERTDTRRRRRARPRAESCTGACTEDGMVVWTACMIGRQALHQGGRCQPDAREPRRGSATEHTTHHLHSPLVVDRLCRICSTV